MNVKKFIYKKLYFEIVIKYISLKVIVINQQVVHIK
jgi:hypothetical protein